MALSRVLLAGASNNNSFQADDRHYGTLGPFTIDAGINLSDEEFNEIVRDPLIPDGIPQQRIPILTLWLARPGEIVHLVFRNSGVDLESGSLRTHQNIIGLQSNDDQGPWATYVLNGPQADWQTRDSLDHILSTHSYDLRVSVAQNLSLRLNNRFKLISEFRSPVTLSASGALETMTGQETAGVLFNLKNSGARSDSVDLSESLILFTNFSPDFR